MPLPGAPVEPRAPVLSRLPSRRILIGGIAALAVAALVTTGIVVLRQNGSQANSHGPGNNLAPPPTISASPSTTPTGQTAPVLPTSRPLTATELIVPMQTNGNWDLYLADTRRPGPVRKLTHDPGEDTSVMLSQDRRTFLYITGPDEAHRNYRVAAAAVGDSDSVPFPDRNAVCAGGYFRGAWNPVDPTMLAVPCMAANGTYGLYLMHTDGKIFGHLPIGPGSRADDPAFSPDGKKLVYWAAPAGRGGGALYVASINEGGAGGVQQLTAANSNDADPAWSPDGSTIAFRRRIAGNSDIYSMPADGSAQPIRIIHTPGDDQDPTWSPSGKQLAYKSDAPSSQYPRSRVPRIWIANADGTGQRLLWIKNAPGPQTASAWSRR